ncbi:flagellar filament capping protein FliD [Shewanella eurypsychrophilus]|uniref:Flagellar hook-associated protein 2 n=1 Tax=Shewanella eurypsychrophilus TaxID=2593656 RepID=A0ABX6V2K2_9GAMM|nr:MULTISPECIES: flagellar filament capping protein FliD [Shewanella]QFU20467.1 flagellar filament capping protein FliD [Shewanella sp. YLB-09]QFU20748.1 flagellar filament capping protein FliD [Shewanella sp. YLB-09]QPG56044.1 flagellar filament capping protein FliD [Shewanella eurypsychrophilus]
MISGMSAAQFAEQLIMAERMGKDQLYKNQIDRYQAQLDAYGVLEKSLNNMISKLEKIDGDAFDNKTVSVSDDNASVTVGADAPEGSYDLKVKQLAQAHQLTKTFASEDATGLPTSGDFTIEIAGEVLTLDMGDINSDGSITISQFRDHINNHSDNPGVQASLVRTGGSVEFMLTSTETGAASEITVLDSGADFGMTPTRAAQDALATLNGISIQSSSNYLENVVDGMNIELNKVHQAGESSTITVGTDFESSEQAVNDFVDAFNTLMDQINKLTRSMGSEVADEVDDEKDDDDDDDDSSSGSGSVTEEQLGVLKGDSSVRMLQNSMRQTVFAPSPNGMRLSDIGIEMTRDGKLEINDDKLSEALKSDPSAVKAMFTDDGGYVDRLDSIIDPFTKSNGYLDLKQGNLDKQVSRVEDNMDRHDYQMQQRYQIYLAQFTAMEANIMKMSAASGLF